MVRKAVHSEGCQQMLSSEEERLLPEIQRGRKWVTVWQFKRCFVFFLFYQINKFPPGWEFYEAGIFQNILKDKVVKKETSVWGLSAKKSYSLIKILKAEYSTYKQGDPLVETDMAYRGREPGVSEKKAGRSSMRCLLIQITPSFSAYLFTASL